MKQNLLKLIVAAVIYILAAGPAPLAAQEERVALVISTSGANSADSDVDLMTKTLKQLGFSVWGHKNLNREGLRKAIASFLLNAKSSNTEKLLVFYYAGAALQIDAENYLLPAGGKLTSKEAVQTKGFRMSRLVEALQSVGAKNHVFVFDAWAQGGRRLSEDGYLPPPGLAPFVAPLNSIVAFSAHPGQAPLKAAASGGNSAYAAALSRALAAPGLTVEEALKAVRAHMATLIPQDRAPWDNSSLVDDVYLSTSPESAKTNVKLGDDRENIAAKAWQKLEHSATLAEVDTFLKLFGDTPIAGEARKARTFLQREQRQTQGTKTAPSAPAKSKPAAKAKIAHYFPKRAQPPILTDRSAARQWRAYVKGYAGGKYTFSRKAKGREVAKRLKFGWAFGGLFNEVRRDVAQREQKGGRISRKEILKLMRAVRDEQEKLEKAAASKRANRGLIVYLKSLQAGLSSYPLPWRPKPDFGLLYDQMEKAYPELDGKGDKTRFVKDADAVFIEARQYHQKHERISISDIIKMMRRKAIE